MLAKSPFSNLFLFFATAAALAIHVGATFFAPTQFVLRLAPITDWQTWLRMVLVAASILVAIDLHKLLRRPPWMSIRAFYGQEEATSVSRRA